MSLARVQFFSISLDGFDHMHTVVVPIALGRGVRLWDGLEGIEQDYEIETAPSPTGATHVTFTVSRNRGRQPREPKEELRCRNC